LLYLGKLAKLRTIGYGPQPEIQLKMPVNAREILLGKPDLPG